MKRDFFNITLMTTFIGSSRGGGGALWRRLGRLLVFRVNMVDDLAVATLARLQRRHSDCVSVVALTLDLLSLDFIVSLRMSALIMAISAREIGAANSASALQLHEFLAT